MGFECVRRWRDLLLVAGCFRRGGFPSRIIYGLRGILNRRGIAHRDTEGDYVRVIPERHPASCGYFRTTSVLPDRILQSALRSSSAGSRDLAGTLSADTPFGLYRS